MDYKKLNNITGWAVFAFALLVYLLTVAPTASFWDCGEFIACSNELEVTHPPGAPLFLLTGRIFAMLSFGNTAITAFMVNMLSVLSSAFTVLFTFWIITMLAKKALKKSDLSEKSKTVSIMIAGVIGAMACTFADSVWFNAVEAEVYAMSSFFTAIVFWLILKWEARADQPDHLRWIILIAYIMGLSIGVHLLNLLTIPALAMVYYYRKFEFSWIGVAATLGISFAILLFIQYGVIQELFSLTWAFEKFFTGTVSRNLTDASGMGMPIGTGAAILGLIILGSIAGLLFYSSKKKMVTLNTAVLCLTMILVGFSSYSIIFIRSGVNSPIDMNNPENILTFLSYMKREQYGNRPLVSGTMYNALPDYDARGRAKFKETGMRYMLLDDQDRYVEDDVKKEYKYKDEDKVLFPRMYSAEPKHYNAANFGYKNYVRNRGQDPNSVYDDKPTRGEDMKFFFDYQFRHMYLRYFMWNFVGRSSDRQDANWEAGLEFGIKDQPKIVQENKGKNHFFYLPLLLGIFGFIWQFASDRKNAVVIGLLFLVTGVAIILYLNQTPPQPRERDYSYAGSFQTFCIWIGLGVLFVIELIRNFFKDKTPWVAGVICLLVPGLMGIQGWNDHTRKGRYIDIEFAKNLLNSCAENAVLFTGGDNDTFPLWYVQEVEGFRSDVRVVNLELLISDWYIDQMKNQANESAPLPISMTKKDYAGEKGLVIQPYNAKTAYLPTNLDKLIANGAVTKEEAQLRDSVMAWKYNGRGGGSYILRKDSVMMNVVRNVADNGWERPLYFANTIPSSNFLGLADYFRLEGLAYRLLPINKKSDPALPQDIYYGRIGQDIMYKNLTENFYFTNLNNPSVNYDEHIREVIIGNYRNGFFRLANSYMDEIQAMQNENGRLAAATVDSVNAGPEIQQRIQQNRTKMEENREKIKNLVEFMEEHLPYEVSPPNVNFMVIVAQMVDFANLDEVASRHYKALKDRAIDELRSYKARKFRIDQNNMAFKSAIISAQFFARNNQMEVAEQIAKDVQAYTGSTAAFEIIQREQLQQQNQ